jgi:hypothetical protein
MFDADCDLHQSRNKNTLVLKPIDTGKHTNLGDSEKNICMFSNCVFPSHGLTEWYLRSMLPTRWTTSGWTVLNTFHFPPIRIRILFCNLNQLCTNPCLLFASANEYYTVATNIFGPSLCTFLHVTLVTLTILKVFLQFWKICTPLVWAARNELEVCVEVPHREGVWRSRNTNPRILYIGTLCRWVSRIWSRQLMHWDTIPVPVWS